MRVVKQNRRLHIASDDGTVVYTPPSFVAVPDRDTLTILAERLAAGEGIRAIASFERAYGPRHRNEDEKRHDRAVFRAGRPIQNIASTTPAKTDGCLKTPTR